MRRHTQRLVAIMFILATLLLIQRRTGKLNESMRELTLLSSKNVKCDPDASLLKEVFENQTRFLEVRATRRTSDKALHNYLISLPEMSCNESFRAGKKGDGGWHICISEPFLPKPPCLVYSFGINYDFSFDDTIAKTFSCTVKAFDPSMARENNHVRAKHIHFIKEGISGRDFKDKHGWNLYSLATILKNQNDTDKIIDFFKMDVEYSEWDAIPDMATKGTLKNIKQIGIEIHRPKSDTSCTRLMDILEDNGFRRWKMDYNVHRVYKMADGTLTSRCLELYYINTRFLDSRNYN